MSARAKYLLNVLDVSKALTGFKVLDATWLMPALKRSALKEFESAHVPGAQYFDLDDISDHSSPYPHMLPSSEVFSTKVGALGISNADHVVVYDTMGLFSAARCWYMFRGFGHDRVSILDGGLPAWKAAGLPLSSEVTKADAARYHAKPFDAAMLRTYEDIVANEKSQKELVVDARPPNRFNGEVDEPRAGLPRGRIEHSVNVPWNAVTDSATGRVRTDEELREIFTRAGVDASKPLVVSCGSGVTACVSGFAALISGVVGKEPALYDGSYTEYAMRKQSK